MAGGVFEDVVVFFLGDEGAWYGRDGHRPRIENLDLKPEAIGKFIFVELESPGSGALFAEIEQVVFAGLAAEARVLPFVDGVDAFGGALGHDLAEKCEARGTFSAEVGLWPTR